MQSPLPQLLFLKGSDLASLLTEFPALSMTLTSIPMEIPKSLQAAFIFSVSSPAVGSIINGAETLLAPVWCQVVAFLSFSSLGAALCKLLARWIGRTPPSSSSHIFLNFLTASMMTWWRTVSGQPLLLSCPGSHDYFPHTSIQPPRTIPKHLKPFLNKN